MTGAGKGGLPEVVMVVGVQAMFPYVNMAGCEVKVKWRGVWVEADGRT